MEEISAGSPESSQLELYAFNALLIILFASFLTSSHKPWRSLLNAWGVVGEIGFFNSLLYSFGSWALSHSSLPCRSGPYQLVLPCVVLPRGMAATIKGLLTLSEMSKFFLPPTTTTPWMECHNLSLRLDFYIVSLICAFLSKSALSWFLLTKVERGDALVCKLLLVLQPTQRSVCPPVNVWWWYSSSALVAWWWIPQLPQRNFCSWMEAKLIVKNVGIKRRDLLCHHDADITP